MKDFIIQKGFKIVRDKNEKSRVICYCATIGCLWRIHAFPLQNKVTYKIKTYNSVYACVRLPSNSEANSTRIAKKLRENLDVKLDIMQSIVNKKY